MQADTEHVNAEPGQAGNYVAEDSQQRQTAVFRESTPPRVQDNGVPQDNEKRSVFFRIPAPEPAPRLVRPNPTEDGGDEAEQRCKTNYSVHHPAERSGG